MSTDSAFTPPKKKPNVLWWVVGGFVVLALVVVLQLFGPNPPIVVSPQTTRITSPLGADGLPDYERYLLEKMRDGVTPDNNAAALIWTALWPGELDPNNFSAVTTELGLEKIPSPEDSLVGLYSMGNERAIYDWLKLQGVLPEEEQAEVDASGNSVGSASQAIVDDLLAQADYRPWSSAQIPPLGKWVAENKVPLDLLVEASTRPRCYYPSPSLLDGQREPLWMMLLPGVQGAREAGRSLPARAMWHLGEGRSDEAWRDLLATHHIGRLVAQGPTLVEGLVGIAIDGIASEGTLALLSHGDLNPALARQIQRDLESLPNLLNFADALDSTERISYLNAVIETSKGKGAELSEAIGGGANDFRFVSSLSVDWNVVLRKGNEFYDRYVAAARLTDRDARKQAFRQLNGEIDQLGQQVRDPANLAGGVISQGRRSEMVAAVMINLLIPAVEAAAAAQDRANAKLELLRLAAALAVFRAEHGVYPEKLDDLVPAVLPKVPKDPFNSQPYRYRRIDDGYLLYATGENGVDDGGSNKMYRVLQGRAMHQWKDAAANEAEIPEGADDWSIRLPTPMLELPKPVDESTKP